MFVPRLFAGSLYGVACVLLACPAWFALADSGVSLEDSKSLQDPFEFTRQLDYRQFGWIDYHGADIDDVTIYQVRYTHPFARGAVLPEQFVRLTTSARKIPLFNRYGEQTGSSTGMGDTNIFDAFTLGLGDNYKWGIGPSVTFPTNQNHGRKRYDNDNWLGGVAGIGMVRFSARDQFTVIFNWQRDVAGNDVAYNQLNLQPAVTYNFDRGWFFLSSGIWQFDFENDTYYIPIALGFGRAIRIGDRLMYGFVEPQWVVDADDKDKDGNFVPQPKFLVRLGLTLRID